MNFRPLFFCNYLLVTVFVGQFIGYGSCKLYCPMHMLKNFGKFDIHNMKKLDG